MRTPIMDNVVADESIAFQTESAFFKELVLNLNELKKENKDKIQDSELIGILSNVVKHHTGLNIIFNIDDNDPQVTTPMVNKNNILIDSFIKNYINSSDGLKMINDSNGIARGSVNLKTGMVSGIFTTVKSTIDLPISMLISSTYTTEEIAAITLHEVGHLFVYYEYMTRMVTTNQMLAGLSKALDNTSTAEERESVLITVKKAANLTTLDTKTLAKTTDKKIAEIVVISNIASVTVSELGSNIYDFSTWEYLADQYVARQGAGRVLATALEKTYKGYRNMSFRSTTGYLAMEALKVFLIISPLISIGGISLRLLLIIGIILTSKDSDNPAYDRPGERIKRIRDQIVENLKNKKLNKEDIANLKSDLVAIDLILKEITDRRQWLDYLSGVFSSATRKAWNQELLQKELENLATNDLFIKAAELKLIS